MNLYQPQVMLVTGGAGFIGSHFIHYALRNDPQLQIINVDLLTYAGSLANMQSLAEDKRYRFIQADITDKATMTQIFSEYHVDTVVHFAAESHVDRSITGPAAFIQTNIVGTFTLLEVAREYWLEKRGLNGDTCRFHHVSTDEVFGSLTPDDPPFTEVTPYAPNSPYSASKAASDHLVRAYFTTYGLPITMTNCSNNYGPWQHPEKFIPTVIRSCLEGKSIPIYGNGKNKRDWLYVEDHCVALDLVLRKAKPGATYNIGGEGEYENITIATKICTMLDAMMPQNSSYQRLLSFVVDRPGHDFRYAMQIDKINNDLQWWPQTGLDRGLMNTILWYSKIYDGHLIV